MSLTQALDQSLTELRHSSHTITRLQGGVTMVGHAHPQLKREVDLTIESDASITDIDRLGSSMSGAEDRRSLDTSRSPDAHQLRSFWQPQLQCRRLQRTQLGYQSITGGHQSFSGHFTDLAQQSCHYVLSYQHQ